MSQAHTTPQDAWKRVFSYGMTTLVLLGVFGQAAIQASGGLNWPIGEGRWRGVLVDFSRQGWLWQTFEGQLQTGPSVPVPPDDYTVDFLRFSATDPEVVRQLEKARDENIRVVLHYRCYLLRGWNRGATAFEVYQVDFF